MEYLLLGKVIDSFSLDGTMKIYSTTNNAIDRYKKGNKVFLYDLKTNQREELTVISYRRNGQFDFVRFVEITTPEQAKQYKGFEVQIIKDNNQLKEGYYFYGDLRGCSIIDQHGKVLGIVKEVEEFPSVISLRIKRENNKDFFVPFLEQFIKKVDIEYKQITINVVEGML